MRVEICERGQGVTSKVMTLKAKVLDLRKDLDYLKSTDFTSLFESEETDEEQLDAHEATINGDLPYLEETIVQSVIQTSLIEMSMAGSSGASVTITPGTDAQHQSFAHGIDSSTDGVTV
uniref:Polyprotein protein n=1 Tax=Solanum tuberosum TaxID=4113 RepID=M1DL38_SOLTU